ncbi:hypothetical protein H257_01733 [Aphanomyces astaci]|uniref:Uncharacterized protein n=1 Tax=Aphanomyces astaci TaxID=112090 RepID=W4H3L9_APHAT|nr:hypothetical protein H257_01733 [Aphanomyces astaci]ETV86580.1 hypothetical protein H257_01733 [Aphanomyces astaci]|eukprot:XP_009823379.1 hypothetical protein H257_01733 [Aphanomyces astaci]
MGGRLSFAASYQTAQISRCWFWASSRQSNLCSTNWLVALWKMLFVLRSLRLTRVAERLWTKCFLPCKR